MSHDYSTNLPAHAEHLSQFFTTLFGDDRDVHIFPGLSDTRFAEFDAAPDSLPDEICGRQTKYWDSEACRIRPLKFLDPFCRRTSTGSLSTIRSLHQLNSHGYGIFFAINPLAFRKRCQKSVLCVRHILIESDTAALDMQLEAIGAFKPSIASVTFSGRRSHQALVRLHRPLWNPHRVRDWIAMSKLAKGNTNAHWPEYLRLADHWLTAMRMHGVEADSAVARDYARVSRVPGFLHPDSGKPTELIWLNPDAGWDWGLTLPIPGPDGGEEEQTQDELADHHEDMESRVDENTRDLLQGKDVLFRALSPFGGSDVGGFNGVGEGVRIGGSNLKENEVSHNPIPPPGDLGVWGGVGEVATTIVVRSTALGPNACSPPETSFLDDVQEFSRIRAIGLPSRHTRRMMHKALFQAARVFGWEESRISDEWEYVIQRNLAATAESPEGAVDDMLGAWKARPDIGIYLPQLTRMPPLDDAKRAILAARLEALGCVETRKAARIVECVLLPLLRAVPAQCLAGTANVLSTRLRDVTNIRGSRGYRAVWSWMETSRIVECTNPKTVWGIQARQYRINAALVIWLCGYQTLELDWSVAITSTAMT